MKKVVALALLLIFSSCTKSTKYGNCVGLYETDPRLVYEINTKNLILGIVFIETIIVPVYVATEYFYCPIGKVKK